jgi:PAS domain S-box-containing protein
MAEDKSTRDLLISTLRDFCKAASKLEKLDGERMFIQQALDTAKESYRLQMEEAPFAILLVDRQGNIFASNKASETLLACGAEKLAAMNLEQLYEEPSQDFSSAFRQILEDGEGTIRGLTLSQSGGQATFIDSFFSVVAHEEKTFVQVTLRQPTEGNQGNQVRLGEKRYVQGLELLSRTDTGLLEASRDENIYRLLGNYIGKLVGDGYVVISSFDQASEAFFVKDITGPERHAEIILGLLLRHLLGTSFRISKDEFERYVLTCTPVAVSGGLHGLFVDRLPMDVYNAMEDFFLFGSTYIVGLVSEGEVFGMATILMPKAAKLDHPALVATLMQQASAVLKYRREGTVGPHPGQPEPLMEGFHHILAEELPYPLEPYTAEKEDGAPTEGDNTAEIKAEAPAESEVAETHDVKQERTEPDHRELRRLLGRSKILVVDNEEIVRDVTGGMLNYMGCKVGYAKNGLEAVARFKSAVETRAPFDAVILDLSLSGGPDAAETAKQLKQINARVKVLASTGNSDNPLVERMKELGFHDLVRRPYRGTQLAEALNSLLSKNP